MSSRGYVTTCSKGHKYTKYDDDWTCDTCVMINLDLEYHKDLCTQLNQLFSAPSPTPININQLNHLWG